MDREERIRKRLNLLKPFIGVVKAEKLWVLYMWGDYKKKAKLESMINTLAQRHLDLLKGEPELEPIPIEYCKGDIFLGDDSLNSLERQFIYEIILKYSYYHYLNSQQREQAKQLMILEEFQALLRKNTGMNQETFIETLFRMGRELGIGLIYICQNISQVPVTILQNTNTTICLNQNHEYDIRGCAFALLLNRDEYQLLSRLPVGHAIMRMSERYTKPFKILVPKMEIEKGKITDKILKDFRDSGTKDVLQ